MKAHGIDRMHRLGRIGLKDAQDTKLFATARVSVKFWDTLYWDGFDSANYWANKGYELIFYDLDYVYMDFPYEVNLDE